MKKLWRLFDKFCDLVTFIIVWIFIIGLVPMVFMGAFSHGVGFAVLVGCALTGWISIDYLKLGKKEK